MDTCIVIKLYLLYCGLLITISSFSKVNAVEKTPLKCGTRTVEIYKTNTKQRGCSYCKKFEICKNNTCVCPLQGASPCRWVQCSKDTTCFPGSCARHGGSTCNCHSDFKGDNCKSEFRPSITSCNVTLRFTGNSFKKLEGNCNGSGTYVVDTYAKLSGKNVSKIDVEFFSGLTTPFDFNESNFEISNPTIKITVKHSDGFDILNCQVGKRTVCSNVPNKQKQITSNEISMTIDSAPGKIRFSSSGPDVNAVSSIVTININNDETKPNNTPENSIFFCETVTKNPELRVYWSGWQDNSNSILKYKWFFYKMEPGARNTLVTPSQSVKEGDWEPGDPYPMYAPQKDQYGAYSAVVLVEDQAGNQMQGQTWVLYDPGTSIITTEKPITIQEAKPETQYLWITKLKNSNGNDKLTLNWSRHFESKIHPDAFKSIESKGYIDNLPALWKNRNQAGFERYEYQWLKGDSTTEPKEWHSATSLNSTVEAPRDDGDEFTAWVRAHDMFGNILADHRKFYVDSSPPEHNDSTKPAFEWDTFKRINGIQHYTSSITVQARDKESGIHKVRCILSHGQITKSHDAVALTLPQQDCKAHSDCTCSKTGKCQRGMVEAAMDNCVFRELPSGQYDLEITVFNEALLPATSSSKTQIQFNENTTDGLHKYPPPENLAQTMVDADTANVTWQYIQACYTRERVEAWYFLSNQRRDLNLTANSTSATIDGLGKGAVIEFIIRLHYAGGNQSDAIFKFVHNGGLGAGAVSGIVIFVLLLLGAGVAAGLWYHRYRKPISQQRRPLPTPPVSSHNKSQAPLPVPPSQVANGIRTRPPPPLPTEADDEIEVYGNVDVKDSLRVLAPQQYSIGKQLGSGRLAVVKQATLKDSSKNQKVAAKMPKNKDSNRDKIILRAKLNFMVTEVTDHPNVVNLVAADLTEPILFLELCEEGPLADWVKANEKITQAVKDKMLLFCLDIACGLKHLHSINIIHRRLGIRNVLLTKSPKRQIARVTGFGPLESEVNSDKEDNRVPVRWMAPESFEREPGKPRLYTKAADMWSYGTTVWEIFSHATMPFKGVKAVEVKENLQQGERLSQPMDCPQELFDQIMQPCWQFLPQQRPSAENVCTILTKMTSEGRTPAGVNAANNAANAMELDIYENTNPTFQNDELYVNNAPIEQPTYLDMCA